MKKAWIHLSSKMLKLAAGEIEKKFEIVEAIESAELIIVDNLDGLQQALLKSKEVEILLPMATWDDELEKKFGYNKLTDICEKNPRIKLFDAFGREGSKGDALDFFALLNQELT